MDRRILHRACRGPAPPGVVVQAAMSLPPPTRVRNAGHAAAVPQTVWQQLGPLPPIQHRLVCESDYGLVMQEYTGLQTQFEDPYERSRAASSSLMEIMALDHDLFSTLVLDAPNVAKARRPAEQIYRNMQVAKALAKVGKLQISNEGGRLGVLAGTITRMLNRNDEEELERLKRLLLEVDLVAQLYYRLHQTFVEEEEEVAKMMRRALGKMRRNQRDLAPPVPRLLRRRSRSSQDAPQSPKRRRTGSSDARRSDTPADGTAQLGDVSHLVLSPASTPPVPTQDTPTAPTSTSTFVSPPPSAVSSTPPPIRRKPVVSVATRSPVSPTNPPFAQGSPRASSLPANPPPLQRQRPTTYTGRPLPQSPTRHVSQSDVRSNGASRTSPTRAAATRVAAPTSPIPSAQPNNPPPIPPKRSWSARPDVHYD